MKMIACKSTSEQYFVNDFLNEYYLYINVHFYLEFKKIIYFLRIMNILVKFLRTNFNSQCFY